jgi:DNA replication protein DnaC
VWDEFYDFQTLDDPQLKRMKNEAVSFIDDLFNNRQPRWLSLLGTSGAGKTMLARRIWHLFRDFRHGRIRIDTDVRVIRWRGGFINWGAAVNNRMLKGEFDFLDDMRSWDFFVIDDIASEHEKHRELSASKLYNILEGRLGKWTILTANLTLSQLSEKLETRIASRMVRGNSVVVDVDVADFNLR